ncbi:MAG TPA: hypothetical protein VFZ59_00670 [Verrucomicrobiae bacterium]|nr:hypothetical protein [Verrucomicrobiae bacterium]
MKRATASFLKALFFGGCSCAFAATNPPAFPLDPQQQRERTCFQTGQSWSELSNLRSDVAIVYGIDAKLPERIQTWRDRGYRIHVMTGVSWGNYQDYLYGRFDGINHEDEAQTVRDGRKSSHGGDVYYMCPGTNFGKFLCVGVQRALDAGAEAIHLEEPEYWVNAGYSEGFKREWQSYYGEPWQAPHRSVDAQWRASRLKYFLYRRALQQVFDYVQDYNKRTGRRVRCYVPTHSLLNYASWEIVSPESSLARLKGCDGYIAQVWTGTSREPNKYRGVVKERTFETAFLEYGAMQNLVRATGRTVWYLNDPIEDNPNHDWDDYQRNWECTLTASLFQPEVWQFEVAPWPERIFSRRYPRRSESRKLIPPAYATELQVVMNALNDMKQDRIKWDCGTTGIGLIISDSLMFQRGEPVASDEHLSQVYGLALPLLKRGMPVTPVQLENVTLPGYLDNCRVLLLSYHGQKPLSPDVHTPLADWVKRGGALVVCDDDADPYNRVTDWWNSEGLNYATPREHLFERLGIGKSGETLAGHETEKRRDGETATGAGSPIHRFAGSFSGTPVGKGRVLWLCQDPATFAASDEGDQRVVAAVRQAAKWAKLKWRETNYLLLERGPYVVAAGLDESREGSPREITRAGAVAKPSETISRGDARTLRGRYVNLFDPELRVRESVRIEPNGRYLLRDLKQVRGTEPQVLASAGKALLVEGDKMGDKGQVTSDRSKSPVTRHLSLVVEGVARTPGVMLLYAPRAPREITLEGQELKDFSYSARDKLLWIRFENEARPRTLTINF